ncbi:LysM peptidoglycan-binding domain-containing protein [Salipaludibacillus aurantiacus]|uniref:LysM domain-containing protein n=1 Tax=Salipaludibacillus aurantiacus TaxID=1601833 RepID=A0A1H9NY30_9BACI|nr:LysM peptidoglycan-binding domain-containing protein [Salipaludibacillus aurantiacus]SER40838.1 LysM domain-containing protein [Salipaludibacillus aurantiacus]
MAIQRGTHIIHTVKPGDTVYSLAVRYESDIDAIARVNGIYPPFTDPFVIFPGQVLVIPRLTVDPTETFYVIQPGDNLTRVADRFSSPVPVLAGTNPTIQNPDFVFPNQQIRVPVFIYDVEAGDSLFSISQKTGVPTGQILNANMFRPAISPDLIFEGIKLIIPILVSQNIFVTEPLPGSTIQNNSRIEGYARAFEANVLYRVVDTNNMEVASESFTTADFAGPNFGKFRDTITFNNPPSAQEGELQVYTRSAEDGSIQDLVQIKVNF